jgi:hypothetical protein
VKSATATRALSMVLGAAAIALGVALTWQGMSKWHPPKIERDAGGDASAFDSDASALSFDFDASFMEPLPPREMRDSGVGFVMNDGKPVPLLSPNAPRNVRFGVVLVSYAGAEDAPRGARTKADARTLAEQLAAQAKTDFHAAVRRGDDGSADDVGGMQRGVLEPAPEFVLFSLEPGAVSDPIDTPRGFWVVKRIE